MRQQLDRLHRGSARLIEALRPLAPVREAIVGEARRRRRESGTPVRVARLAQPSEVGQSVAEVRQDGGEQRGLLWMAGGEEGFERRRGALVERRGGRRRAAL